MIERSESMSGAGEAGANLSELLGDRELLELAAKAAGIECEWHNGCGDALYLTAPDAQRIFWNPLRDDGDAFRLATALMLTIYHAELAVIVKHKQYSWEWMGEGVHETDGDRNASTRRVIVKAAAAMATQPVT